MTATPEIATTGTTGIYDADNRCKGCGAHIADEHDELCENAPVTIMWKAKVVQSFEHDFRLGEVARLLGVSTDIARHMAETGQLANHADQLRPLLEDGEADQPDEPVTLHRTIVQEFTDLLPVYAYRINYHNRPPTGGGVGRMCPSSLLLVTERYAETGGRCLHDCPTSHVEAYIPPDQDPAES